MSDTPVPAAQLPLFFKHVVGVNPALHQGLRLDRSRGFAFSAEAQSVPLGLGEFEVAAQNYPIVFTAGASPMPVALLGLREGSNLFVQPDGGWRANSYVPGYVRAFPFIFVEDNATKKLFVGMEQNAECISPATGAPLFEDGKPSQTLNEAIAFCSSYRDNLTAAGLFARAMDAAGLLEEEEATINFTVGGGAKIRGFKMMKAERLERIDDATFLDWRSRGWLGAIYAHLFSAGRWSRLIELAAPAMVPAVSSAAAPGAAPAAGTVH